MQFKLVMLQIQNIQHMLVPEILMKKQYKILKKSEEVFDHSIQ